MYAKANNIFPTISFEWRGDYLSFFNQHFEEFWTITILTTDNVKGLVFTTQKIILRSLECAIDSGRITINTTWEPEVQSLDGVTAICPELFISFDGIPPLDWNEYPGILLESMFSGGFLVTST